MKKSRYYKLAVFLAAQIIILAGLFGLLEGLARYMESRIPPMLMDSGLAHPPYLNNPGKRVVSGVFGKCVYTINSYGLRGPEIKEMAGAGRILILGDSLVFGARVGDTETTPARLELLLNSRGGRKWQVLNGGASSYDAWDYEAFFRMKGLPLKPDIVIVNIFMNDNIPREEVKLRVAPPTVSPGLRFFNDGVLRYSALARNLLEFANERLDAKRPLASFQKPLTDRDSRTIDSFYPDDPGTAQAVKKFLKEYNYSPFVVTDTLPLMLDAKAWKKIRVPLASIARLCRENGILLLGSVSPCQFELYPGYKARQPHTLISQMFQSLGIETVDLKGPLLDGGGYRLYDYRYDVGHPNSIGYALAAETYALKLSELGWVGPPAAVGGAAGN